MTLKKIKYPEANAHDGQGEEVIHLKDLTKSYNTGKVKVDALKGINLRINHGEMVAIMGPSGSGKSTLMNLLGCLDTATSGSYQLLKEEVSGLNREQLAEIRNQRIGFIFQSFNLLPQITSYENVEMPLLFGGIPKRQRRERVHELMERVGLTERMEHKPTELSGGQMQRVAIARALAMEPDIILFHELWEQGHTVLVITHDPALAQRAPRQVEIRDGLITMDNRN
jgi:putative ABC transport system ATP-binding protein